MLKSVLLAKGTIKIPNFSQENDIDDDVDLSSTRFDKDEIQDNDSLKFVKNKGHKEIRKSLQVNHLTNWSTNFYLNQSITS